MSTESLLDRTYSLLDAAVDADGRLKRIIYKDFAKGAAVDVNWLAKFKQRQIPEPGVKKIQRLHDFLVVRMAATPVPAGNASEQQHTD